ncbi:MAG TPA: arylamine N-acetyltransferase [Vicinamibacterales bacterium]|nr:arylamine N-acetyltransferase [Vicinamibacterales bacterium]
MPFDAPRYLERIGWRGPLGSLTPTLETLTALGALLRAHMRGIPFENLDVLLGRGIRLDLDSVSAKLVDAKRGGYCFEHSTLFRAALEHAGFEPRAHSARVILLTPRRNAPRTHMFLTAAVEGTTYVLDPGFGGHGPLVPLPLVEDVEVRDGPDAHRLTRRDGEWVLEARINGTFAPLWMSTLEPEAPIDFTVANHFTATWPESAFVQRLMLRALTPDGRRVSVMNRDVTVARDGVFETSQLASRSALRALLEREFQIDLPEVERLRVPTIPEWD